MPLSRLLLCAGLLASAPSCCSLSAQPAWSPFLKVDLFGYRPEDRKIAVIADPQVGFDAALSYTPGPRLQLRREPLDAVVLESAPELWSAGATHADSGDRCWQFDFSSIKQPGHYHVYDPSTGSRSPSFLIAHDVYRPVAIQAARMFFYQRSGYEKKPPYVPAKWADGAAFRGPKQDSDCRLVTAKDDNSTARDLSGGWFDAGDYNKYVTFCWDAMHHLFLAYEEHPKVWGDNHGIPESGNGIPDLLDEVKWNLDWVLRIQQADGSVLNRVHDLPGSSARSPASADAGQRCYGPASTMSTLAACDMYAHGALVFGTLGTPEMTAYAEQLKNAAIKAWVWANANRSVAYDDTGFGTRHEKAKSAEEINVQLCRPAAKLFALTGENTYRTHFDTYYNRAHLFTWSYAYVFEGCLQDDLLYYSYVPGATASVVTAIQNKYASAIRTGSDNLPRWLNKADPYESFSSEGDYTWGSNRWKCEKGLLFKAMLTHKLDSDQAHDHAAAAAGYVHYIHGLNPLSLCFLSNMREFGAESSTSEFYHHWFANGTVWDSAILSPKGPPPGYLTGGVNPKFKPDSSYTGPRLAPPMDQPPLKAYRDWNTSWPQNSWEVTEPAIYYQAAYLRLLAGFLDDNTPGASALINMSARAKAGAGDSSLIPGFVISGKQNAPILLRAIGPGLAGYGVSGVASDPELTLLSHHTNPRTLVAANNNWWDSAQLYELEQAHLRTGAFPLAAQSLDACTLTSIPAGAYTARAESRNAEGGIVLVELYDALGQAHAETRLVNMSCRAHVSSGDNILVQGFVIDGPQVMTVLLRAIGPKLADYGVTGVLDNPSITLYAEKIQIGYNDDWQDQANAAGVYQAMKDTGAFLLDEGSKDAALLVNLPPGLYTLEIRGLGPNPEGNTLGEIYLLNAPKD